MIIQPKGSSGVFPSSAPSQYKPSTRSNTGPSQAPDMYFDQVNISRQTSTSDQFRKEVVSRLVREVRTSHTANDIQRIKAEVHGGTYQPDATEIASKLLLEANNSGTN